MFKVVLFDKQTHDLNVLRQMTDAERMELAEIGVMLGDNDVAISSLYEFEKNFNNQMVSPEHSYIFFIEQVDPHSS